MLILPWPSPLCTNPPLPAWLAARVLAGELGLSLLCPLPFGWAAFKAGTVPCHCTWGLYPTTAGGTCPLCCGRFGVDEGRAGATAKPARTDGDLKGGLPQYSSSLVFVQDMYKTVQTNCSLVLPQCCLFHMLSTACKAILFSVAAACFLFLFLSSWLPLVVTQTAVQPLSVLRGCVYLSSSSPLLFPSLPL